ncbi:peptidylprolyl isomerase [Azorhizobium oxalatiphilum]|uniref:Parvulin-like PPIase n=1 Tax=Azorhizobium oxalatiphilum TaxID=980631 RepID=A0A917BXQ5_9HYPH|nr:peptidyl-prolyl cis-trans isomerase [Azorhizobium oxalatiphilum]GGF59589.1 peptidylprolyl isomerase [Azorhizobium oxalatiphilum]
MVLQNLRKGASGLIAKVFLLVLMVSFVLWGISGVFTGSSSTTVATVGNTDVSADAFRQRYLDRIQSLGRQSGRGITQEQARAFGLDRQILSQMITEATLDDSARVLGLSMADADIVQAIHANQDFWPQGASAFDPAYFARLLQSNNLTEQRFLAEERKRVLRQQLVESLGGGVTVPGALTSAVQRYEDEQRTVSYLDVTSGATTAGPAPTEEQLKAYYETHKAAFRAPEYRKLNLLVLTPATLAPWVQVSDADLKAAYERNAGRFGTPEQREVQQIVFPNQADAVAALEKIKAGTPFADIAASRGLTAKDTDLGLVAKSGILDPKVADAAFALAADGTSDPIQGRFGYALVHVTKVVPATQKPLEEVSAGLRQQLVLERARRELMDKHDAIEDERNSGATIAETAQKVGLSLEEIEAVDRSGRDTSGAEITSIPDRANVLSAAFASRPGTDNDPVQLPQNAGYIWYDVTEITPSRERPFDEAKDQVASRWAEDEVAKAVDAKAKALLAELQGGKPMADVATANSLEVKTATFKRSRAEGDFTAEALTQVFSLPQSGFGMAAGTGNAEQLVFQVTKIDVPAGAVDPRIASQLQQQIESDVMQAYLSEVQKTLGLKVNERTFLQATGGAAVN